MSKQAMLGLVVLVGGLAVMLPHAHLRASQNSQLDDSTARHLAAEGVWHTFNPDDFISESYMPLGEAFYNYSLLAPPPATWGMYGFFSVNRRTGDVWALWGCHRLSTPVLRKSQADIRRRFNSAEMTEYAKLRRLKPFCIYEDAPDTRGWPADGLARIIRDIGGKLDRNRGARQ